MENQIEMCRQYIRSKFPDDTGTEVAVYEDEGFSAKNRPAPVSADAAGYPASEAGFLSCVTDDRISRNVSDFSALIEDLSRRGIRSSALREEFDTSSPWGKP